jgi:hypothetical protein
LFLDGYITFIKYFILAFIFSEAIWSVNLFFFKGIFKIDFIDEILYLTKGENMFNEKVILSFPLDEISNIKYLNKSIFSENKLIIEIKNNDYIEINSNIYDSTEFKEFFDYLELHINRSQK